MQLRYPIGAGLIVGAMAVVAVVTYFDQRVAYYAVDDFVSEPAVSDAADAGAAERVQLRGEVDPESVTRAQAGLEMRFDLVGKSGRVPVVYHGLVPDTFDLAESVTVGGALGPEGAFVADELFVQCPSKYEAAPPDGHPDDADRFADG